MRESMINGMINIYKEAGFTSHDVVAKLRGILKQKKIGHTGTLDPEAVGVLPVCLGNATKLCELFTDKDKEYEAWLQLGVRTDTQDLTGTVLEERPVEVTEEQVREVMLSFVGDYAQLPPMYSALKVGGQRLYELARQGKEVERALRPVTIYGLRIQEIKLPGVRFTVSCSRGTYIRTLCHDIGEKLGCGGAMESLKRTKAGGFQLADALTLAQVEALRDAGDLEQAILPVEDIFAACPKAFVKEQAAKLLQNGNVIWDRQVGRKEEVPCPEETFEIPSTIMSLDGSAAGSGRLVRMYDASGEFYGIYEYREEEKAYRPYKMFLPTEV